MPVYIQDLNYAIAARYRQLTGKMNCMGFNGRNVKLNKLTIALDQKRWTMAAVIVRQAVKHLCIRLSNGRYKYGNPLSTQTDKIKLEFAA